MNRPRVVRVRRWLVRRGGRRINDDGRRGRPSRRRRRRFGLRVRIGQRFERLLVRRRRRARLLRAVRAKPAPRRAAAVRRLRVRRARAGEADHQAKSHRSGGKNYGFRHDEKGLPRKLRAKGPTGKRTPKKRFIARPAPRASRPNPAPTAQQPAQHQPPDQDQPPNNPTRPTTQQPDQDQPPTEDQHPAFGSTQKLTAQGNVLRRSPRSSRCNWDATKLGPGGRENQTAIDPRRERS